MAAISFTPSNGEIQYNYSGSVQNLLSEHLVLNREGLNRQGVNDNITLMYNDELLNKIYLTDTVTVNGQVVGGTLTAIANAIQAMIAGLGFAADGIAISEVTGLQTALDGKAAYEDSGAQPYAGVPDWTGGAGTPPSGTETHSYRWTRIGKLVTLRINLKYSVAGVTCTVVKIPLPAGAPVPNEPDGFGAADAYMLQGTGAFSASVTGAQASSPVARLRVNGSDNGYLIYCSSGSNSTVAVYATIQYWSV